MALDAALECGTPSEAVRNWHVPASGAWHVQLFVLVLKLRLVMKRELVQNMGWWH